jgi:hypothetical protein
MNLRKLFEVSKMVYHYAFSASKYSHARRNIERKF